MSPNEWDLFQQQIEQLHQAVVTVMRVQQAMLQELQPVGQHHEPSSMRSQIAILERQLDPLQEHWQSARLEREG